MTSGEESVSFVRYVVVLTDCVSFPDVTLEDVVVDENVALTLKFCMTGCIRSLVVDHCAWNSQVADSEAIVQPGKLIEIRSEA